MSIGFFLVFSTKVEANSEKIINLVLNIIFIVNQY